MDDKEVGKYWNENAENWTKLTRMGYDIFRNCVNAPEFFKILPDVTGLKGLDIGCGEGYNTRLAAQKGGKMTAIDISEVFINHAIEKEKEEPLGIKYQVASAGELPFETESFDFVISTMALMDMPEIDKAFSEAYRVLKSNGFFQFSIIHPCFSLSNPEWIYDDKGKRTGLICRDYFKTFDGEFEEWIFDGVKDENLPEDTTPIETKSIKINFYLSFKRILLEVLNLDIGLYFQSKIKTLFNNPRVASCTELSYQINENVSIGIVYRNIYDFQPIVPIDNWYHRIYYQLSATF